MRTWKQLWTGILSSTGLLLLILDAKTALLGAKEGVDLCLYTLIPSLFPFFVLSILVNRSFTGKPIAFLRPVGKICGIPEGAESLLLLGFLGGYPIGAQSINEAYRNNTLCKDDARRMLGFCSNAGPAFLFGILGSLFESVKIVWILWGIHIMSALAVGCILPDKSSNRCQLTPAKPITLPIALERSIKAMANVCGWVVVFRILIAFCKRWFFWLMPQELQISLIGLLELSNGCCELYSVISPGVRFILSAGLLGSGGICVAMQTLSVTKESGTGMYFPGKLLQCAISVLTASLLQHFLFPADNIWKLPFYIYVIAATLCCFLPIFLHRKKSCSNPAIHAV